MPLQNRSIKPGGWNSEGLGFSDGRLSVQGYVVNHSEGVREVQAQSLTADENWKQPQSRQESRLQIIESVGGQDVDTEHSVAVGAHAPRAWVQEVCTGWGMPWSFLRRILKPGALPCFVSLVEEEPSSSAEKNVSCLKAINLGFRWGAGHGNYVVFFGRFDVKTLTLRGFLSSLNVLDGSTIWHILDENKTMLMESPLEFVTLLLESCEQYVDRCAQDMNKIMLEVGVSLQVVDSGWTGSWGIQPLKESINKSSTIYATMDSVSWLHKNCRELVDIGKQFLSCLDGIDKHESETDDGRNWRLARYGARDILHRAELHRHMLSYLETMLASQFGLHGNLLAQHEAQSSLAISVSSKNIAVAGQKDAMSMKTVSYLTLVFLPATFVSAIFSTTIFDFQNWEANGVVSPGWWIFVVSCGLATLTTLGIWFQWHRGVIKRWLADQEIETQGRVHR
jgi:hypothetical protein